MGPSSHGDGMTARSYLLTYGSANVLGGVGQAPRTVIASDTRGPIVTLLGDDPILITNISNWPVIDSGARAFDVYDAGSSSVTGSTAVNVNFPGTYAITYRSTGV